MEVLEIVGLVIGIIALGTLCAVIAVMFVWMWLSLLWWIVEDFEIKLDKLKIKLANRRYNKEQRANVSG